MKAVACLEYSYLAANNSTSDKKRWSRGANMLLILKIQIIAVFNTEFTLIAKGGKKIEKITEDNAFAM